MTKAWTTPETWNVGTVVTAQFGNDNVRDNSDFLKSSDYGAEFNLVNSTAWGTALKHVVAAGALGTAHALRVEMLGDYRNATGANTPDLGMQILYGGQTLYAGSAVNITNDASARRALHLAFTMGNMNVGTVQTLRGRLDIGPTGGAGATTVGIGALIASSNVANVVGSDFGGSATYNSANAGTLIVRFRHSAASTALSVRKTWAGVKLQ